MGAPSFKECIAADVSNVFLNRLEFADTHTVNGKKMAVLVDENELLERDKGKLGVQQTGLYKSRRLIYVARTDFGPRPAIGAVLTLDRQQYRVVDCKEETGILSIELGGAKVVSENQHILQIDTDAELQKIIRQLDSVPDQLKAPSVLAFALNATANEMRRKMGKKARKRYAVTDDRILTEKKRGGMFTEKASGQDLEARLISKGALVEAMAYMTRKNEGATAAMLKVLNESQLTALEVDGRKAFETTFDSGHTAIVRRLGKERLPVYQLMSPAVPNLYGVIYGNEEMDYYAILQKHIQRQVDRVLERRAA